MTTSSDDVLVKFVEGYKNWDSQELDGVLHYSRRLTAKQTSWYFNLFNEETQKVRSEFGCGMQYSTHGVIKYKDVYLGFKIARIKNRSGILEVYEM